MVQLVFVHGVATRTGPGYSQSVANRDTLFRTIAFEGSDLTVRSPLWGDFVPRIDPKVFETDRGVGSFSLGGGAGQMGGLGGSVPAAAGPSLVDVAKQNAIVALDAAFSQVVAAADQSRLALSAEELAAFRKAVEAIEDGTASAALAGAGSDAELAKRLGSGTASFGIGSTIEKAISAVSDRIRNTASTVAFGAVRDFISPAVGFFLGDVFAYLQDGNLRDKIREVIRADLVAAHEASKQGGGPVIVVGHSMGGVILADMLQDPPAAGLPQDLVIAALFTVGSQPGLFRSLGVLSGSSGEDGRTLRPPCVKVWYNVFDPIDPLAFRADAVYSGVEDLRFDSITGLASAHTTYFKRPQFYARFRKRVAGLGQG